jgi:hypothetical protein
MKRIVTVFFMTHISSTVEMFRLKSRKESNIPAEASMKATGLPAKATHLAKSCELFHKLFYQRNKENNARQ